MKAVYADASESEPAPFDFCESDLALELEQGVVPPVRPMAVPSGASMP